MIFANEALVERAVQGCWDSGVGENMNVGFSDSGGHRDLASFDRETLGFLLIVRLALCGLRMCKLLTTAAMIF